MSPMRFTWDGEVMQPWSAALADKEFVIGQQYILEEVHARSRVSHNHFFACLESAWRNLPEKHAADYATVEHLRKRLLIQAGFYDESKVVFTNGNDAIKAASLVLSRDDYCVATAEGRVLTVYIAKSQSMKAMGRDDFQRSKEAVLDLAAELIGTTAKALSDNAKAAA